jgi:hypothetical protein
MRITARCEKSQQQQHNYFGRQFAPRGAQRHGL